MPRMTSSERDTFLTERGILMRVATVDAEGAPYVTPIWFAYEEGRVWFTPRKRSAWLAHLRRDPRVALCIDEQPLPYRKLVVRGRAQLVHDVGQDDVWRERYRRIARRYIDDEAAEAYIQATIAEARALFSLDLASAQVQTWRMPLPGDPPESIWHARYYDAPK